jgi:hypothetical protein
MNWAWATSLDYVWRSPAFPMWLTLAAAGFFGILVLITLLRAEKSVANGALTVITLVAVGIAVAATIRGFGPLGRGGSGEARVSEPVSASLPALSCIDDLAGETVLAACEKTLFGSPESTAAAVSYAAAKINRLTAAGDVATANAAMTADLQSLRGAIERDRYGLMAYVLLARDHCTPFDCAAFRSLTDRNKIAANMDQRIYEGLIIRYASSWNAPPATVPMAALPPLGATGKPTNAEFPSAASTPPVSIMTPEPGSAPAASRPPAPVASAPPPAARPAPAAKKQAAPKASHPTAPTPIAPPPPAAAND